MKIHGNIEAGEQIMISISEILVSMDENPWQHWSSFTSGGYSSLAIRIHGWKSMATLKLSSSTEETTTSFTYPWMKIHGNIEAWEFSGDLRKKPIVSMDENPWQHWSQANATTFTRAPYSYPWMKIHGNIEADDTILFRLFVLSWYPWMKIHGNIEAPR